MSREHVQDSVDKILSDMRQQEEQVQDQIRIVSNDLEYLELETLMEQIREQIEHYEKMKLRISHVK